jgi:type II secretory pathway pseudopilin PulG
MVYKKGYSVIEVLLAGSILALSIAGIVGSMLLAQRNNQSSIAQSQALVMAQEGIIALKSIRDRDYNNLTNIESGGLNFDNGQWNIIENPLPTDDQLTNPVRTRRVKVENDATPDAKLVTVTVIYEINPEGDTSNIELSETLINMSKKPIGTTAESANYRLVDDNLGDITDNQLKIQTP